MCDFENHDDIILADDGKGDAFSRLLHEATDGVGNDLWPSSAITTYSFFFLTWFPSYLNHSLHLDIKEISIATVIPWVIGAIGMVMRWRML